MNDSLRLISKLSLSALVAMFALSGCASIISAKVEPAQDAIVAVAAPSDSDNDGVPDDKDACPETRPGVAVDHKGCEIVGTLENPHFEFDSAALTNKASEVLNSIAVKIRSLGQRRFEVAGHTDSKGSDEYNNNLGEKRAISVVEFLNRAGVSSDRLTIRTYGESQPIASNDTEEGQSKNRRVEIVEISN